MSAARDGASWWRGPLAHALARFNLVPAAGLHRSRAKGWPVDPAAAPAAVSRRASAAMAREMGLALDLGDPGLPLALLPAEAFSRLMLYTGVGIHAHRVRRAITREEVRELHEQLGEAAIAFARLPLPGVPAALVAAQPWDAARAREHCEAAGAGLLDLAFDCASAGVAQRGRLRLPADAAAPRLRAEQAGVKPKQALGLLFDFLGLLEPAWLSSFPAPR